MKVTIDSKSGYCFGVEFAIQMAEDALANSTPLYCLGDIVHNAMEIDRLTQLGLKIISHHDLSTLKDCKVLIRAHGEPPETYQIALKNNIQLIDASCPVVLKLQNRIKHSYDKMKHTKGQIVLYGQKGHAEVVGLTGQTQNEAIVVTDEEDLEKIDFTQPIAFYSQTTKSTSGFYHMKSLIEQRLSQSGFSPEDTAVFDANDSICRQVSNREPQLNNFALENDLILFVSGKKSSNGKALYEICKKANPRSYFIENELEIDPDWLTGTQSVGICGATSTPMWLMDQVAAKINSIAAAPVA